MLIKKTNKPKKIKLKAIGLVEDRLSPVCKLQSNSSKTSHQERTFVDRVSLKVRGGNGGDGMIAFTAYFAKEFAGPDGGDGRSLFVCFLSLNFPDCSDCDLSKLICFSSVTQVAMAVT